MDFCVGVAEQKDRTMTPPPPIFAIFKEVICCRITIACLALVSPRSPIRSRELIDKREELIEGSANPMGNPLHQLHPKSVPFLCSSITIPFVELTAN